MAATEGRGGQGFRVEMPCKTKLVALETMISECCVLKTY